MKDRKKGYTKEFKEEAVNVALEAIQSYKKTARDLGVSSSALCAWIRQHRVDQAACWTVPNKSIASMAKNVNSACLSSSYATDLECQLENPARCCDWSILWVPGTVSTYSLITYTS